MHIEILLARHNGNINIVNLCNTVSNVFNLEVQFKKIVLDFGIAFDSSRLQYNSTKLLELAINSGKLYNDRKSIIITDLDLFVPVLTYVFGEAELNGRAAIASSHRLHNEYYGLPRNDQILQSRMEKEIIHELGHTFGLIHCAENSCVMHSSSYVEDIDLKLPDFCESCKSILIKKLNSNNIL